MNNNQGRKRVRRARRQKANISRILLTVCMMALIAVVSIGGTLAWLSDKTEVITNTFTTSDIEIKLEETTTEYEMVPGDDIEKDPVVTFVADSEDAWLFVKVTKTNDFDNYMTYAPAQGWTKLEVVAEEVYYREVTKTDEDQTFAVLADNKVTVKGGVTKDMMTTAATSAPTMTFTAYAVQKEAANTATDAWTIAKTIKDNGSL